MTAVTGRSRFFHSNRVTYCPRSAQNDSSGREKDREKERKFARISKRYILGIHCNSNGVDNMYQMKRKKLSRKKIIFINRNSLVVACFFFFIIIFSVKSRIVRCRCTHVCARARARACRTGGSYDGYFGQKVRRQRISNGTFAHMPMTRFNSQRCRRYVCRLYHFFGISFVWSAPLSIND